MNAKKKARLEAAGFRIGDAAAFLGLTDEEQKVIELRLRLAKLVRQHRTAAGMTQNELARKIGSSQPRVAKLETGAAGVTLDLQFRCLFALGGNIGELAASERKPRKPRRAPKAMPAGV